MIPSSKHCNLLTQATLPIVQEPVAVPSKSCPTFYSECDNKGQTIKTCSGVNDFTKIFENTKTLGAIGLEGVNTKGLDYWAYYKLPNCSGEINVFKGAVQCINTHWNFKKFPVYSARAYTTLDNTPNNCIIYYTGSCNTGNKTVICNDYPDLTAVNFNFSLGGSFQIYYSGIIYAVFYSEKNFSGNAMAIPSKDISNLNDYPILRDFITNAKSVSIRGKR